MAVCLGSPLGRATASTARRRQPRGAAWACCSSTRAAHRLDLRKAQLTALAAFPRARPHAIACTQVRSGTLRAYRTHVAAPARRHTHSHLLGAARVLFHTRHAYCTHAAAPRGARALQHFLGATRVPFRTRHAYRTHADATRCTCLSPFSLAAARVPIRARHACRTHAAAPARRYAHPPFL